MLKTTVSHKGSSLVLIIIITAILMLLCTGLLSLSLSDTKGSVYQNDKVQAHYIAQSGVDVGFKILKSNLATNNYDTVDDIVTAMNTYVTGLGSMAVKDSTGAKDIGTYTVSYEKFGASGVKIISHATIPKIFSVHDTVSYLINITNSTSLTSNPSQWFTGVNLQKGYGPNDNYLDGVILGGVKVQSPKNGAASTFRSEIIYFLKDGGFSFRQVMNSVQVTFDAFVIYAEGKFIMNNSNDPAILTASNVVLNNWNRIDSGMNAAYKNDGFESYDRYKDFVRTVETDTGVLQTHYNHYSSQFLSGKYGVVYFGGDIVKAVGGSEISLYALQNPRYYFFRSGMNLHDIKTGDLIRIDSDDPVIEIVKNIRKFKTDISQAVWNNK